MSDIHPGTPRDDADRSPFTIEDTGSTTDAADLVGGERAKQNDAPFSDDVSIAASDADGSSVDRDPSDDEQIDTEPVDTTPEAFESADAISDADVGRDGEIADDRRDGETSIDDGRSAGHVFDETNGVVEGLDGESDGFAQGDAMSSADRADQASTQIRDVQSRDGVADDARSDRRSIPVDDTDRSAGSRDHRLEYSTASDHDGQSDHGSSAHPIAQQADVTAVDDAAFSDDDSVAEADADREPVDTEPADTLPADSDREDPASLEPAQVATAQAVTSADDAGDTDTDAGRGGLASLDDDGSIGHVFDQTNGVIDRLDGDSDGSAESDVLSSGERADENPDYFQDADVRGVDVDDSRITGN